MKLISFRYENNVSYGLLQDNKISKLDYSNFNDILKDYYLGTLKVLSNDIDISLVELYSPILNATSLRDAYAFRKHVEAGRNSRGLDMIPEYDEFPIYYYSNHNAIRGPGIINIQKDHMLKLDFELEIAAIIGKKGINIDVSNADDHIFGYTIMNDLSARQLQKKEMKLNLGPVKGKDFATTLGPYIITVDELKEKKINGSDGDRYDLDMRAYHNNKMVSKDNFKNITWTFAQIISRVSYGTTLYPGDVIGSGTCSTGCYLELNQTHNTNTWLKDGDEIKLEIECLGSLVNIISEK